MAAMVLNRLIGQKEPKIGDILRTIIYCHNC